MSIRTSFGALAVAVSCVPSGSAGPADSGPPSSQETRSVASASRPPPPPPPADLLRTPFEDSFDGASTLDASDPGSDWAATAPNIWRLEAGRLCGDHAHNHGIWLKRSLPTNAHIEFDAVSSDSTDGDLKAEYWGDGRSYATALSYTNATSYLTIFGGWHNKFHVLARINEHGNDRKEITVDPRSDDPRERPVVAGQMYHFKVERADGKTVRWWINGNEMLSFPDSAPLSGPGHDHFGFNDWEVKVCFDNVRVVPLP